MTVPRDVIERVFPRGIYRSEEAENICQVVKSLNDPNQLVLEVLAWTKLKHGRTLDKSIVDVLNAINTFFERHIGKSKKEKKVEEQKSELEPKEPENEKTPSDDELLRLVQALNALVEHVATEQTPVFTITNTVMDLLENTEDLELKVECLLFIQRVGYWSDQPEFKARLKRVVSFCWAIAQGFEVFEAANPGESLVRWLFDDPRYPELSMLKTGKGLSKLPDLNKNRILSFEAPPSLTGGTVYQSVRKYELNISDVTKSSKELAKENLAKMGISFDAQPPSGLFLALAHKISIIRSVDSVFTRRNAVVLACLGMAQLLQKKSREENQIFVPPNTENILSEVLEQLFFLELDIKTHVHLLQILESIGGYYATDIEFFQEDSNQTLAPFKIAQRLLKDLTDPSTKEVIHHNSAKNPEIQKLIVRVAHALVKRGPSSTLNYRVSGLVAFLISLLEHYGNFLSALLGEKPEEAENFYTTDCLAEVIDVLYVICRTYKDLSEDFDVYGKTLHLVETRLKAAKVLEGRGYPCDDLLVLLVHLLDQPLITIQRGEAIAHSSAALARQILDSEIIQNYGLVPKPSFNKDECASLDLLLIDALVTLPESALMPFASDSSSLVYLVLTRGMSNLQSNIDIAQITVELVTKILSFEAGQKMAKELDIFNSVVGIYTKQEFITKVREHNIGKKLSQELIHLVNNRPNYSEEIMNVLDDLVSTILDLQRTWEEDFTNRLAGGMVEEGVLVSPNGKAKWTRNQDMRAEAGEFNLLMTNFIRFFVIFFHFDRTEIGMNLHTSRGTLKKVMNMMEFPFSYQIDGIKKKAGMTKQITDLLISIEKIDVLEACLQTLLQWLAEWQEKTAKTMEGGPEMVQLARIIRTGVMNEKHLGAILEMKEKPSRELVGVLKHFTVTSALNFITKSFIESETMMSLAEEQRPIFNKENKESIEKWMKTSIRISLLVFEAGAQETAERLEEMGQEQKEGEKRQFFNLDPSIKETTTIQSQILVQTIFSCRNEIDVFLYVKGLTRSLSVFGELGIFNDKQLSISTTISAFASIKSHIERSLPPPKESLSSCLKALMPLHLLEALMKKSSNEFYHQPETLVSLGKETIQNIFNLVAAACYESTKLGEGDAKRAPENLENHERTKEYILKVILDDSARAGITVLKFLFRSLPKSQEYESTVDFMGLKRVTTQKIKEAWFGVTAAIQTKALEFFKEAPANFWSWSSRENVSELLSFILSILPRKVEKASGDRGKSPSLFGNRRRRGGRFDAGMFMNFLDYPFMEVNSDVLNPIIEGLRPFGFSESQVREAIQTRRVAPTLDDVLNYFLDRGIEPEIQSNPVNIEGGAPNEENGVQKDQNTQHPDKMIVEGVEASEESPFDCIDVDKYNDGCQSFIDGLFAEFRKDPLKFLEHPVPWSAFLNEKNLQTGKPKNAEENSGPNNEIQQTIRVLTDKFIELLKLSHGLLTKPVNGAPGSSKKLYTKLEKSLKKMNFISAIVTSFLISQGGNQFTAAVSNKTATAFFAELVSFFGEYASKVETKLLPSHIESSVIEESTLSLIKMIEFISPKEKKEETEQNAVGQGINNEEEKKTETRKQEPQSDLGKRAKSIGKGSVCSKLGLKGEEGGVSFQGENGEKVKVPLNLKIISLISSLLKSHNRGASRPEPRYVLSRGTIGALLSTLVEFCEGSSEASWEFVNNSGGLEELISLRVPPGAHPPDLWPVVEALIRDSTLLEACVEAEVKKALWMSHSVAHHHGHQPNGANSNKRTVMSDIFAKRCTPLAKATPNFQAFLNKIVRGTPPPNNSVLLEANVFFDQINLLGNDSVISYFEINELPVRIWKHDNASVGSHSANGGGTQQKTSSSTQDLKHSVSSPAKSSEMAIEKQHSHEKKSKGSSIENESGKKNKKERKMSKKPKKDQAVVPPQKSLALVSQLFFKPGKSACQLISILLRKFFAIVKSTKDEGFESDSSKGLSAGAILDIIITFIKRYPMVIPWLLSQKIKKKRTLFEWLHSTGLTLGYLEGIQRLFDALLAENYLLLRKMTHGVPVGSGNSPMDFIPFSTVLSRSILSEITSRMEAFQTLRTDFRAVSHCTGLLMILLHAFRIAHVIRSVSKLEDHVGVNLFRSLSSVAKSVGLDQLVNNASKDYLTFVLDTMAVLNNANTIFTLNKKSLESAEYQMVTFKKDYAKETFTLKLPYSLSCKYSPSSLDKMSDFLSGDLKLPKIMSAKLLPKPYMGSDGFISDGSLFHDDFHGSSLNRRLLIAHVNPFEERDLTGMDSVEEMDQIMEEDDEIINADHDAESLGMQEANVRFFEAPGSEEENEEEQEGSSDEDEISEEESSEEDDSDPDDDSNGEEGAVFYGARRNRANSNYSDGHTYDGFEDDDEDDADDEFQSESVSEEIAWRTCMDDEDEVSRDSGSRNNQFEEENHSRSEREGDDGIIEEEGEGSIEIEEEDEEEIEEEEDDNDEEEVSEESESNDETIVIDASRSIQMGGANKQKLARQRHEYPSVNSPGGLLLTPFKHYFHEGLELNSKRIQASASELLKRSVDNGDKLASQISKFNEALKPPTLDVIQAGTGTTGVSSTSRFFEITNENPGGSPRGVSASVRWIPSAGFEEEREIGGGGLASLIRNIERLHHRTMHSFNSQPFNGNSSRFQANEPNPQITISVRPEGSAENTEARRRAVPTREPREPFNLGFFQNLPSPGSLMSSLNPRTLESAPNQPNANPNENGEAIQNEGEPISSDVVALNKPENNQAEEKPNQAEEKPNQPGKSSSSAANENTPSLIEEEKREEPITKPKTNEIQVESAPEELKGYFDFEAHGLPADFLEKNEIDLTFFQNLPEELKLDVINQHLPHKENLPEPVQSAPPPQEAKPSTAMMEEIPRVVSDSEKIIDGGSPIIQQEPTAMIEETKKEDGPPPPLSQNQSSNRNGINGFFTDEDMNALPPDIREEILQWGSHHLQGNLFQNQNPGNFASLDGPDNQTPLLNQTSVENQLPIQREESLATVLASLPQDIREDALQNLEIEQLRQLPPSIQDEAMRCRERAARAENRMNEFREMFTFVRRQNENGRRRPFGFSFQNKSPEGSVNVRVDKLSFYKLFVAENKLIEKALSMLYVGTSLKSFPMSLVSALCFNPINEYKITDCLLTLLAPKDCSTGMIIERAKENEATFPPETIVNDSLSLPNFSSFDSKALEEVMTLKILFILSTVTHDNNDYFLANEPPELEEEDEQMGLKQRLSSGEYKGATPFKTPGGQNGQGTSKKDEEAEIKFRKSRRKPLESMVKYRELHNIQNLPGKDFRSRVEFLVSLLNTEKIKNSSSNLVLLIQIIKNVLSHGLSSTKSSEGEALKMSQAKLSPMSVSLLCQVLLVPHSPDSLTESLSQIISSLSKDKEHVQLFISELNNILFDLCKTITQKLNASTTLFKNSSKMLEKGSQNGSTSPKKGTSEKFETTFERELMYSMIEEIHEENKFQKVFKIYKELFDKMLLDKSKEIQGKLSPERRVGLEENSKEMEEEKQSKPSSERKIGASPSKHKKQADITKSFETAKSQVRQIFESILNHENLRELWLTMSELLSVLSLKFGNNFKQLNPVIVKHQPLIESFFLFYKILSDDDALDSVKKELNRASSNNLAFSTSRNPSHSRIAEFVYFNDVEDLKMSSAPTATEHSEMDFENLRNANLNVHEIFLVICEKNKKVLNHMIKNSPTLVTDAFSIILKKLPGIIDFENKREYFKARIKKLKEDTTSGRAPTLRLSIKRKDIFNDSFQQLSGKTPHEMKGKLNVEFRNEDGTDAGGLTREWFSLLSKQIFLPDYCLFKPSANGNTFQPDRKSGLANKEHFRYFRFVGRFIGKALMEGQYLDAFFTRSFYKHMTGARLDYHDMEDLDPEIYKGLVWILENDVDGLGYTFSYLQDDFGDVKTINLKENGVDIEVDNSNKIEYVQKYSAAKLTDEIKDQIESFLEGLHELIPRDLLSIFDPRELELMISGLPEIDLVDLQENTEYHQYTKDDKVIQWLWEILFTFDKQMKANFLQFVTGTSKVPLDGFKSLRGNGNSIQKFQIHKAFDPKKLPIAHTCFNQLDLPLYPSKEVLVEKLVTAIIYGKEGFGFM